MIVKTACRVSDGSSDLGGAYDAMGSSGIGRRKRALVIRIGRRGPLSAGFDRRK